MEYQAPLDEKLLALEAIARRPDAAGLAAVVLTEGARFAAGTLPRLTGLLRAVADGPCCSVSTKSGS